jgi:hypothetical protein
MNIIKAAIAANRLDLAAYALVLSAIRNLTNNPTPLTGRYEGESDDRKEHQKPDYVQQEKATCAVK